MAGKPRYSVSGWGSDWWVESRNHKIVAHCYSQPMARKIAKLLIEDADHGAEILARVRACEQVLVDEVEHVRLDGHDHYLAYSLLEELLPS